MFDAPASEFLVPFDGSFDLQASPTRGDAAKKEDKKRLKKSIDALSDLQEILYAANRHSVLLVFQAMDAAGKDSTIRSVMQGINPAGCQVFSFKKPSSKELDHDFLWRTTCALPERGRIGIFNRSYYEEVLVVRVHPKILTYQQLPESVNLDTIWKDRFESILDHEQHLARNGTVILKFWLNVSKEEQRQRFLSRLNNAHKLWKFNADDLAEREHWDEYMQAYEDALQTSRPWAPWYAIPADDKPFMRATVADIVVRALQTLDLRYPSADADSEAELDGYRKALS